MITDKNEAFKHNSCKKLAQLGKVIFQMRSLAKERNDEIQAITIRYESSIAQLVRQHHSQAEGISKDLVIFRKSCIDKACQDYGSAYKNIKSIYSNLCKSKFQELSDIYDECKRLIQLINETKMKKNNESESLTKTTNKIQIEIESFDKQNKKQLKNRIVTAVTPINEKITKYQQEQDKKVKEMKISHSKEVSLVKNQMSKIYQAEIQQRIPTLKEIRIQFQSLAKEAASLREKYNAVSNSYNQNYETIRYNRNVLFSTTRNQFKNLKQQIADTIKNEKQKKGERAAEIAELKEYYQKLVRAHQNELNNLINQVNGQKHQRHQLMNAKTQEMEMARNNFESRFTQMTKDHEKNIAEIQQKLMQMSSMFNESDNSMLELKNLMKIQILKSIQKAKQSQDEFYKQLKDEISKIQSNCDDKLNKFKELSSQRILVIEQALQNQDTLNNELQHQNRQEIRSLLTELKQLQTKINQEMTDKSKKVQIDKEKVQKSNLDQQKKKKEEIDQLLTQKENFKDKEFKTITEKFQNEIKAQKENRNRENDQKLNEYKKSIENLLNLEDEEKQHELNKSRMTAKLQVQTKNVTKAYDEKEKSLNFWQNKLQASEKETRQVQRRIEKETLAIDEEYEMKIQVEQVKLNNAIENLAKLYDKDENQRGVELIDMIRKVRESRNKADDLLLKKKKEIEQENIDFLKEKEQLTSEIEKMTNQQNLKELTAKLESILKESNESIQKIESESETRLHQIHDQIEKLKNTQFLRNQGVRQEITKEEADFQIKLADIHSSKTEISKAASDQISQIQNDFDEKQKRLVSTHQSDANKLKQRIQSARNIHQTQMSESSNSIKTAQQNDADLIKRKCSEDISNLEAVSKKFIEKNHELTDTIKSLSSSNADLSLKIENPPEMRKKETIKISMQKERLNQACGLIQKKFDELYLTIENMHKCAISETAAFPELTNYNSESNSSSSNSSLAGSTPSSSQQARISSSPSLPLQPHPPKEPQEPMSGRTSARRSVRSVRSARSNKGDQPRMPVDYASKRNLRSIQNPQMV